jgi:hypothetical protein
MKQSNLDKMCYMGVQKRHHYVLVCTAENDRNMSLQCWKIFHTNINALLQVGIAGKNTLHFTSRLRYFPHDSTSPHSLGLLIAQVPRSHSDTSRSVGILQNSARPVAEISTGHSTSIKKATSMPRARLEPAILASERPQTNVSRLR